MTIQPAGDGKPFCGVRLDSLSWPVNIRIPSKRFRFFVAGDVSGVPAKVMAEFAQSALKRGMVYFCSWGPDCERFHDIIDDVVLEDDLGARLFVGENRSDTIMTTWHDDEPLDEALDFFVNLTCPTAGFEIASDFWLVASLSNAEWAVAMEQRLGAATFPIGG